MAKSKIESTVILTLSGKEAFWLKALMQNPWIENEQEPLAEQQLREGLFSALPDFDILSKL